MTITTGCEQTVSDAEKIFYKRAADIRVGAGREDVKAALGEPTRVINPMEDCKLKGGHKEWVYETVESAGRKIRLQAGSIVLCMDKHGIVKQKLRVRH